MITGPTLQCNIKNSAQTLIESWRHSCVPIERMSWTDYFILQAYLISTRSLDARTRCGSVITSPEKDIVSTGYNSFIRNIKDDILPNSGPAKYDFMIHSEHNAILACARHGKSCKGAYIYITGLPCINCLQFIYQAGISKLYYLNHNTAHCTEGEQDKFDILAELMRNNLQVIKLEPSKILLEKIDTIQHLRV